MIFLLTFSTLSPFPVFADEAVDFPGSVSGSLENSNNEGIISVTMNEDGYILTLHKHKSNSSSEEQVGAAITSYTAGTAVPFAPTEPGLYYVKAYKAAVDDQPAITKKSAAVAVQPNALTVSTTDPNSNIVSPAKDPYNLKITKITAQKVQLFNNDNNTPIKELPVTASGEVTFDNLDASSKYQVVQIVNGAESLKSDYIIVRPNIVIIDESKTVHSGPTNNAGELFVTGTKKGNTLALYRGGVKVSETIVDTSTYTFKGLSAGEYEVMHIENGVPSERSSKPATIRNEGNPIIDLVDAANYELRYEIDTNHNVTKKKYDEPGYVVTDKNGTVYRGKNTAYFCGDEGTEIEGTDKECTPLKIKVVVDGNVVIENGITPPGKYTVTYTATDGENSNLTSSITRNVTVYPNALNLTKEDTEAANKNLSPIERKTGNITVHGVYQGATVKLYQDAVGAGSEDAILIDSKPLAPEGEYTFSNVPVGTGYFVIQEVKGVASSPSARIEIKDDTPPELKLNGPDSITLEVGESYVEYGATATDNIDTSEELAGKIQISGTVNTSRPGEYTIHYDVQDKAGNSAVGTDGKRPAATRTVYVLPGSVTAIGSIATLGEVGVENIFPGTTALPTTLKLYKYDDAQEIFVHLGAYDINLLNRELTYVFRKHGPGRYYVTQTVNEQESRQSNIVEIVDQDQPYITLLGPDKIELVWDKDYKPYFKEAIKEFTDPGAKADDYLQADELKLTATLTEPDGTKKPYEPGGYLKEIQYPKVKLPEPGAYKITYTAMAKRLSKADDKHRTIIVAPPTLKEGDLSSKAGTSTINISGTFNHSTTVVNLYNTYNQWMESKPVEDNTIPLDFTDVPAGLGYYVTQTVNGIESAPSEPVDVTLFTEALDYAKLESLEFTSLKSEGVIDHGALTDRGTITVTVPKDTDVTKLKASFKGTGKIAVQGTTQISGVTEQNFTNPVTYTVWSKDGTKSKNYLVTVTISTFSTNAWTNTVKKTGTFTSNQQVFTLSPSEKETAANNGISFISTNRAIHVPAVNVKETDRASLTVTAPRSVSQITDPAWRLTIQDATELKWGNANNSFLQPIEVEMPNPDKKAFAKLVREDGKLYAVTQQSEKIGNNLIGLATEPGMYALVNGISEPRIISSTLNNETTYRLLPALGETGAQIYYTTNSSNIGFDRSARNSSTTSFSFASSPPDLSQWTLYTSGEHISVPNGELYAFAMKDQMISQLNAIDSKTEVAWNDDIPTYPTHKVLSITFSSKVEKKALYSGSIYVKDDSTGKIVDTILELGTDGKTVTVAPKTAYTSNKQYTLYIERQIKGNTKSNEFLKQPLTQTFLVK